jgi:hypothetical protein
MDEDSREPCMISTAGKKLFERVLVAAIMSAIVFQKWERIIMTPISAILEFRRATFIHALWFLSMVATSLMFHSAALADQRIAIQTFPSKDGLGTAVANPLPIYKLHVSNGRLVDDAGNVFNSYQPQFTTPTSGSRCVIPNLNWAAYLTTFYVVLASDQDHMLVVKSCGKSPLRLNSTSQYGNIGSNNFINHAQIAGMTNGTINSVIAAGEIDVIAGKIVYMDTCSGHFQPNVGSFLAFASKLNGNNALALTSPLKDIIKTGSITDNQINSNLISMVNSNDIVPKRNVRSGTGGCYSYTTVFQYSSRGGKTTLTGGLLALNQGNINVFQNDINTITNTNIKAIDLRNNSGIYSCAAYVTTDLHIYNNALDFTFTDETNDTYSLSVHVYTHNHEVDYNSQKPNINQVTFQ